MILIHCCAKIVTKIIYSTAVGHNCFKSTGCFFSCSPDFYYQNEKFLVDWVIFFHFGSENHEEQLKKTAGCIIPIQNCCDLQNWIVCLVPCSGEATSLILFLLRRSQPHCTPAIITRIMLSLPWWSSLCLWSLSYTFLSPLSLWSFAPITYFLTPHISSLVASLSTFRGWSDFLEID